MAENEIVPVAPAPASYEQQQETWVREATEKEATRSHVAIVNLPRMRELQALMKDRRASAQNLPAQEEFRALVAGKAAPEKASQDETLSDPAESDRNDALYKQVTSALSADDLQTYQTTLFDLGQDVGQAIVSVLNEGAVNVTPLFPDELKKWAARNPAEAQLAKEWGGRAALNAAAVDYRLELIFATAPASRHAHMRTAFNNQRPTVRRQILIALAADARPRRR